MQENKNFLFFSKYCIHSRQLCQFLDKHFDYKQMFIPICVDVKGIKLPWFVKTVPTIVISQGGKYEWHSGENAFGWFKGRMKQQSSNNSQPGATKDNPRGIADYEEGLIGSNMSGSFSFLEDDQSTDIIQNFAFLSNDNSAIKITNGSSLFGNDKSSQTESALQQFKEARDRDAPMGMPGRPPPGMQEIDFTAASASGQPSMSISRTAPSGGMGGGGGGMGGGGGGMGGGGGGMGGGGFGGGLMYNPDPNIPVSGGGMNMPQTQQLPQLPQRSFFGRKR